MFKRKDKKGAIPAVLVSLMAIIGVVAVAIWSMNTFGGSKTGTLSVTPNEPANVGGNNILSIPAEDVTVTFSSWDAYAKGTNAGTAHRILEFDGDINLQVNDDSTRTYSPSDSYKVLIGNLTTSLTGGTNYYPIFLTGTLGNKGTETVGSGQYLSAGLSQLTFTFYNDNGDTNTVTSISSNGEKKSSWKITANDNVCVGNPDTGGVNGMSYTYNNTVFSKVAQINSAGTEQSKITTPNSVSAITQHSVNTYTFPTICDNAEYTQKVLLKTLNVDPSNKHNISLTLHDVTWDFDADTLELIKGYQDEDNSDIGVADFQVGAIILS